MNLRIGFIVALFGLLLSPIWLNAQPPAIQAGLSVLSVTSTQVTLVITPGSGDATMVAAQPGASFTAFPANGIKYCANNLYGSGQVIAAGVPVVGLSRHGLCGAGVICQENATTFAVAGTPPGTTVTFKAFELAGCASPSYSIVGGPGNPVTVAIPWAEPTVQASNIAFSSITSNSIDLVWTNGNGLSRIVVASPINPVTFIPTDGVVYPANSNFSAANDVGGGQKVVYAGSGNSASITGLSPGLIYNFRVFEANSAVFDPYTNYLPSTGAGNPSNATTIFAEPTVPASSYASLATTSTIALSWLPGNGSSRIIIMDDAPLTFT
jgi:hypothetical protein